MPNRYANLTPSKKISEDFQNITMGFDKVQADMDTAITRLDNQDQRIDNIVASAGDSNTEIVDARRTKDGTVYSTLGNRLNAEHDQVLQDIAESQKKNISQISDSGITSGYNIGSLNFKSRNIKRDILEIKLLNEFEFTDSRLNNYCDFILEAGTKAPFTITDGVMNITNTSGSVSAGHYIMYYPKIPNFFATLNIKQLAGPSHANPMITYARSEKDRVCVIYESVNKRINVYTKLDGSVANTIFSYTASYPFKLGALFLNNVVVVFVKENNQKTWKYIGQYTFGRGAYDFNTKNEQDTWGIGVGYYLNSDATSLVSVEDFKLFASGLGYRDPSMVTYPDGSPLVLNDRYYMAVTLGGVSVKTSYQGIVSFNPDLFDVRLESLLYSEIPTGYRYGDHAAHIVYDDALQKFYVFFSAWGSTASIGAARGLVATTSDNILSGIHTLQPVDMNLPRGTEAVYDVYVVFDKSANKWRCAYTKYTSPRTIALAESDGDFTKWSLLGQLQDAGEPEGTKIAKVNGQYYVLACAQNAMRYYNYPAMTSYSTLNLNKVTGHPELHPMLFPVSKNGKTKYMIVSMDKVQISGISDMSHGNLWLYIADEVATGLEYPVRKASWI